MPKKNFYSRTTVDCVHFSFPNSFCASDKEREKNKQTNISSRLCLVYDCEVFVLSNCCNQ